MMESLWFNFNGISSKDMGVTMIQDGNGMYKEQFMPTRRIISQRIPYNDKVYFKRVEVEPISFSMAIMINDWSERNSRRAIAQWLFTDYYKPLYFESNPNRIFYAMFQGSPELIHNGLKEGYITLSMECQSGYTYSHTKEDEIVVNSTFAKTIYNEGDRDIYPYFEIKKREAGDIKIKNESNGQEFILTGLLDDEVVTVDNENMFITSSYEKSINRYLFDNHNDIWIRFDRDDYSLLTFTGDFDIKITYQYKYLTEWDALESLY